MKRYTAFLLAILMLLCCTACGGSDQKTGAGHSFAYTLVGNPDTLDPQLAVNTSAKTVLSNLFEGLFVLDDNGNVQNGIVDSYTVSPDGLTYQMTLRKDSYWYSALDTKGAFGKEAQRAVSAMDFVYAFQRLFDPMYGSPYRETFSCIRNAQEILDGKQDPSVIGVYAKKDNELEFQLAYPCAGFPLLLTMTAALPCNQEYFESTKGRYGLDEQSIIGNGSFSMQRWLYDAYGKYNVIQMCRNPLNHENHKVYPLELSLFIEKTDADAANIFVNGNSDCYISTRLPNYTSQEYQPKGAYSLTLGLIANRQKVWGDKDMIRFLSMALDPSDLSFSGDDITYAAGVLPPAVMMLNKSCRELIADANYRQHDSAAAKDAIAAALQRANIQETDEGTILVPAGLIDYSALQDMIAQWEAAGAVHLRIEELPEAEYRERLSSRNFDLALYALTGEFGDAASFFRKFNTEQAIGFRDSTQMRKLLDKAAQQNLSDNVELYRSAEEMILNDWCFLPLFYKKRYLICKNGVEDVVFNPFSGQLQFSNAKFFD
ncbi:MAG: hypothetical protein IK130_12505 [Oscillospiraceae bacterium]|nr:hypothetical protein [Oscillospiraceae bacterium]